MSNETIAIIDYGMGNLRSVQKAIEHVGGRAEIVTTPEAVRKAEKVILPGVGAFEDAIARLRETGLDDAIRDEIATGKWFLGICLGFQLLFERSSEHGEHEGLGLLAGEVRHFDFSVLGADHEHLKIPHMGWNTLDYRRSCPLFAGLGDE
ncbi:MAG: imidazole glycerol phosphate synthase subunit HisH, partial [Phycisphaerales bacterium]|nr:imidazole glycerol phosphate synthase subunit HisH [Phycisphaerales bacterium]